MDTPQEVEVWFVLPALRKLFVVSLKKQGLKQNKIAKLMNITESAVSQYLKNKRGDTIKFSNEIINTVLKSTLKIANHEKYKLEFQKILRKIKKSKFMCTVCHDHTNSKENCNICY